MCFLSDRRFCEWRWRFFSAPLAIIAILSSDVAVPASHVATLAQSPAQFLCAAGAPLALMECATAEPFAATSMCSWIVTWKHLTVHESLLSFVSQSQVISKKWGQYPRQLVTQFSLPFWISLMTFIPGYKINEQIRYVSSADASWLRKSQSEH